MPEPYSCQDVRRSPLAVGERARGSIDIPPSAPGWVDRFGAGLSLTCAVHCALSPLLIAALPLAAASWLFDDSFEAAFVCASIGMALASLAIGFRLHRRRSLFVLLGAAGALIAVGRCASSPRAEIVLVSAGALVLSAAHGLNARLCARCRSCVEDGGTR